MSESLLEAVAAGAKANMIKAKANLNVYMTNAAGIGEHGDVVDEVRKIVETYTHEKEIFDNTIELMASYEQK